MDTGGTRWKLRIMVACNKVEVLGYRWTPMDQWLADCLSANIEPPPGGSFFECDQEWRGSRLE